MRKYTRASILHNIDELVVLCVCTLLYLYVIVGILIMSHELTALKILWIL